MPGILLNSLTVSSSRRSASMKSSYSSLFSNSSDNFHCRSNSPFHSAASSTVASTPNTTASNSALSSPGGSSSIAKRQQVRRYSEKHEQRYRDTLTPPNKHKPITSTSASLWGKEIPTEQGISWGQFIDFDPSY
jgi:hypothetical protein